MQIAAKEAIIKTAAVEIKTLAVSGKQVTLAVFRQMDQETLLDYEHQTLNGIPWGRVNYHPDNCSSSDDHIHIVWQRGSNIYRDIIVKDEVEWHLGQYLLEDYREVFEGAVKSKCDPRELARYDRFPDDLKGHIRIRAHQKAKSLLSSWFESHEIDLQGWGAETPDNQRLLKILFHVRTYKTLKKLDLLFIAV
jgi:hypothetical protein